jgi:hypothetical protein
VPSSSSNAVLTERLEDLGWSWQKSMAKRFLQRHNQYKRLLMNITYLIEKLFLLGWNIASSPVLFAPFVAFAVAMDGAVGAVDVEDFGSGGSC